MDVDDLTVQTVRDGAVCTLILGGALDLRAAGEFLQHAARVLDDRIERLVLDLAGVTFLDCAGVRRWRSLPALRPAAARSSSARSVLPRAGSSRRWALMTSRTSADSARAWNPRTDDEMG